MRTLLLGLVGACSLALLVSGAWAWQYAVHGIVSSSTDIARAVTVDAAGNVLAVGRLQTTDTTVAFTVLKFAGASGAEQWRQTIVGPSDGVHPVGAHAVGVIGSGMWWPSARLRSPRASETSRCSNSTAPPGANSGARSSPLGSLASALLAPMRSPWMPLAMSWPRVASAARPP